MKSLVRHLKKLDKFVVLSEEDRANWPELQNVKVISNPLPFQSGTFSDLNNKRITAAGRYTYQKGFDLLLEAWSKVCNRHPDWELHIYGKGDKTTYQVLAGKWKLKNLFLKMQPRICSVNTMKVLFLYQVPDLRDSEWS